MYIGFVCRCCIVLSVDVFGVIQHYYESINVSQFCSFVIIGDFNACT